jgi:hypothetical protein
MSAASLIALLLSAADGGQAQEAPICTDRPTKANAVCTLPAGNVQIETSLLGLSRSGSGNTRAETVTLAATVARIGLTERSEVQIGVAPSVRLTAGAAGAQQRVSGFGDLSVRYKHRISAESSAVQVAVLPFLKLPTARRGLGNGAVEGGVAVPVSFALAGPVTMTLGPELDLLADVDRQGHHVAVVNLVNLSLPVAQRLIVIGELWSNLNFEPSGTIRQASADVAAAFSLSNRMQLDAGVNVGLTRDTPALEAYAGISIRF